MRIFEYHYINQRELGRLGSLTPEEFGLLSSRYTQSLAYLNDLLQMSWDYEPPHFRACIYSFGLRVIAKYTSTFVLLNHLEIGIFGRLTPNEFGRVYFILLKRIIAKCNSTFGLRNHLEVVRSGKLASKEFGLIQYAIYTHKHICCKYISCTRKYIEANLRCTG